jgi:hypothetical protein
MYTDSLILLSRAIYAAAEAAVVPGLLLFGAVLVVTAGAEIRAHARRRQRRAASKIETARRPPVRRARGAET